MSDHFDDILNDLGDQFCAANQDQRSTEEQLRDILEIATAMKMYDAADAINRLITKP